MKLSTIKDLLQAQVLWGEEYLDIDITNACGADLVSDILADAKTNAILLTGLIYKQIIQTAGMAEFAAIIFVRGKTPSQDVIKLAREKKMPLMTTKYPLYETCGILYQAGLRGRNIPKPLSDEKGFFTKSESMQLSYDIDGNDFNNAGKATEQAKGVLKQIGVDPAIIRRTAISAYEAEMNIVIHAKKGKLLFNISPKAIEVVAEDMGPGIPNIAKALEEGFSTAPDRVRELGFGAGLGLPNMKKFSDDFKIESVVGKGTKVKMIITL